MIILVCPDGWGSVQSQGGRTVCYKNITSPLANWTDPRTACQDEGGDLASIKYQEEYVSFFAQYVQKGGIL